MNKMKLAVALSAALIVLPSATITADAKSKSSKNKTEATSVLKTKKSSTRSFGAVFRRDGGVNQNRKYQSSRGPGFELGFDGHSGGT
ncbi:MAG: hypothetical protein AAGA53_15890 [Pseudomonadota bacterium]